MTEPVFAAEARKRFRDAYPETAIRFLHNLHEHHLLTLPALVELATSLPPQHVEYNRADLPIGVDPADIPQPTLDIAQTIESIEQNGSWMVIKFVEQNPAYRALMTELLDELKPIVAQATGPMLGLQGFVFISSPGAVTPFHFDPEHNILMQIRGHKVMTVFPPENETFAPPLAHEAFHMGEHHRNLEWRDEFATRGKPYPLNPGEAVYVPVKAPHWVKNGEKVSISLSITWRSEWSYAEADARAFNRLLRRTGLSPLSPKRFPDQNKAKAIAYRALRRLGMTGRSA
ncbi:MAG: cupin-like domain-containing protein [Sphingomonadaceae bacterium]